MGMLSVIKAAPSAVVKATGKTLFKLKRVKPQILVGGGIVIATASFVFAIVNARKINDTVAQSNAKVDAIEEKKAMIEKAANLSEEEKEKSLNEIRKELNKAKAEAVWKMFCLIGVPTLGFVGGMAITIGGHRILLRRFGQLSASFAALKESYDRYRAMNIAEHGEECDRRYRYGIVDAVEGKVSITDENGNEKEVQTVLPVVDKDIAAGLYSFEFSENFSRKCPKEPVNTIAFLRAQERYWNVWMRSTRKPVTLAMVLEDLGIELDPDDPMNDYIYIAGWRPNGDGDNEIDFGIMRAINKATLNQDENVVYLNFNCDGNIYHSVRYDRDGSKIEYNPRQIRIV